MATIVLNIEGMHCGSCGLLIDDTIEDLPGVSRAQTRLREATTTVEVDPQLCDPQQLVAAVAEAGYAAYLAQP
jgi:copper chaperone CopZ